MTPQEFVAKWKDVQLKERAAAQEHFIDLCRLVEHPTPAEDDPTGERFTFEAGANKQSGGKGWADVWKRDYFAWEYKGKHANLKKAYDQLLQYRESLLNPPLLVVCDINTIIVHTNFTNTVKQEIPITFDDLLSPDGMRNLRAIFTEPKHFRAQQTTEQVTKQAAAEFALLADSLRKRHDSPEDIAHFLIRVLFSLFAEDIELLPNGLFTRLVDYGRQNPDTFAASLGQLFQTMATGGLFGVDPIRYFDGGLFDGGDALALERDELTILYRVAQLDWSSIEPSIFGTLFQRSLDPSKRSQLGAHYTDSEDILLIVEPVLMAPLRREWEEVKQQAKEMAERRDNASTRSVSTRLNNELGRIIGNFLEQLSTIRVLDPACGSGNFLYMALRTLLDLWKEVNNFATTLGLPLMLTTGAPSPEQLFGIEIDAYAHELAQATVWIGYIQWLHENGYGIPREPILRKLDNIKHMDAILAYNEDGNPIEPEWPAAEVIIGNPPFLGGKRLRTELGSEYVDQIFTLYKDKVPRQADLVCYWFERSRMELSTHASKRVGLLATQSVRAGANREILQKIVDANNIFIAWSDRSWILDGAAVRVSIVGFDNGEETIRCLDGNPVDVIHADLSTGIDLTQAQRLKENSGIAYQGTIKVGAFDIGQDQAMLFLQQAGNPENKSNSDVIKPWANATDVTDRWQNRWIIDFGTDIPVAEAANYEGPFEYVRVHVKPKRDKKRRKNHRERWWIFGEARPGLRAAISSLENYIVTPRVAKHRLFTRLSVDVVPDARLFVFARQDYYFFGILHSFVHETWSLATSSRHGVGNDPTYNNTTCFETFPFPWPPGTEPADDPIVQAIAEATKELVEKRDAWLNPPGLDEKELKKRTLTNLYNARPMWLELAHRKLDTAVLAAYGWSDLMTEDGIADEQELLSRLLDLNLKRADEQDKLQPKLI